MTGVVLALLLQTQPALPATLVSPKDGAEMVLIPAGPFKMGSSDFKVEQPVHEMTLGAFYIDKLEVTNAMYERFVTSTGYKPVGDWKKYAGEHLENHPVQNLTLADCQAYATWAGKRLPSEEEWEKAARGTDQLRYPWGEIYLPKKCNSLEEGLKGTTPVGTYPDDVSPYGVLDMAGNVSEWTSSPFRNYPLNRPFDPSSIPAARRDRVMVRGGSYTSDAEQCRLTQRGTAPPSKAIYWFGFRCVMSPPAPPAHK